jgi:GntR family transcriptional regulator
MNDTNRLLLPPISAAAPGPLYQQIVDGIKREISEGRLKPGQPLPSFRQLAEDLMVSLITVKRAYEELERAKIIYRKQGLGTFVSDEGLRWSREVKRTSAEALMRKAVMEAQESGMSRDAIRQLVEDVIDQCEGERS